MLADIERVLIPAEQIQAKVTELAKIISEEYKDKNLMVVCILKGAMPFCADLFRQITIKASLDFMSISSYGASTQSSGVHRIMKDVGDVFGKDVLIVEDIVDTGLTLAFMRDYFARRQPNSLKVVALLDKPSRRKADVKADWTGFEIPDEFVIGYGLDYAEHYRNLPFIGVPKPHVYEKPDIEEN